MNEDKDIEEEIRNENHSGGGGGFRTGWRPPDRGRIAWY